MGSAGRQMEGFLDVAHFAWVHTDTFGDRNNAFVPKYKVSDTDYGASCRIYQHREQLFQRTAAFKST